MRRRTLVGFLAATLWTLCCFPGSGCIPLDQFNQRLTDRVSGESPAQYGAFVCP